MERFWCPRDGAYSVDDDGFLRDPDATWLGTQSANPAAVRVDEFREHRCLVLLGEPGAGKSTAVAAPARLAASGVPVVSFDLASYGSEDRLVREVFDDPSILAWSVGSYQLCLVLDSLDEARARVPQIGAIIADCVRRLPYDRLFLRIACRTADWPAGLEQSLTELFGAVHVVEILPLRRVDASAIAALWCDPSRLLDEVARAGAGPLAARPLTLRFLARSFGQSGRLPEQGAALYAAGVRSLCAEQNAARLDAGLGGDVPLDTRVAVARRIAAATVFGGASALWTGPEIDAGGEDIAVEHLAGGSEPSPMGSVDVTVSLVLEAARTGLFTSRGGQRLGWAHATFADFLAAEWVVANDLSAAQVRPLFLGPDGRCWPQTRLAAAWTVAIAPDRFEFLIAADPAAFQGEVELPGDSLRAAVIDGLFSVASTLTAAPWERSYRALRHHDIAAQLRPHLYDTDADRRRLAIELADECAATELHDDLAAIVMDITAETHDRVAAGWALTRLPDSLRTAVLRPLALGTVTIGEDPADDLKGVSLLASWPQAMSNAEVFSVLTSRRQRNYFGSYAMFLDSFREGIEEADIDAGLRWILDDLDVPVDDHIFGALANRVLTLAASRGADRLVVDALTQVVLARVKHHGGLLFEDFRRDEREDPFSDAVLRRAVAAAVLAADPTNRVAQHQLLGDGFDSFGIVRADDLAWLAELYAQVGGEIRDAVRSLFRWTYDVGIPEHRDLVLAMSPEHPLYVDLVHAWVEPVALDSPEADEMRRSWKAFRRPQLASTDSIDDLNEQIAKLLVRFDAGEAMGFWYSTRLLTVAPGSKHFGAEFDPDVVGMQRWPTLSEGLRERLVDAADRYLRSHHCQPEEWLHQPEILYHPAEAGYRAMVLLLRVAPERLHRLPTSAWIEWAPVLACWSTASVNGASWDDKAQLFELAGPEAHDVARRALLTRVGAVVAAGNRPFAANEAGYLWDDSVAAKYLSLARSADADPREELITTLSNHDLNLQRELLLEWLEDPSDVDRRQLAARTLLDRDLERSWPAVAAAFESDLTVAEQVFGRSLTVRGFERMDHVSAAVLADIYLWLRAKFPPESDPKFDDVHWVGPREQIGQWRDKLLSRLQDEGSPEAVAAIRAIVAALPSDRWLLRTLASAEAALLRNSWAPTRLSHLLRLGSNRRAVVVNDVAGLTAAVVSGLEDVQSRLTGATPESHYLWDTHAGRPKSEDEISDYLANELHRILIARGVIVNREVQVRRNRPSGIGERTDLLVDAAPVGGPATGRLSLPIEVKGAWNPELLTAMRDQLVGRYMRDAAANDGIFIVLWPDLNSWTDVTDLRRGALASLDRQIVEAKLGTQASELARNDAQVCVVHLSIDYRRPSRGMP
ncbi:NACHT domain-containing protein [Georgenia subflava]|uniref:Uncharacterized protein n=1 Tax=Georgenia subflava TaxID=1622177 RepID=A0A6N7END5_9MICO|nr:hypothetical protein [Georgenia subflava]MPV36724.1 hypothetical protein [Georgenia subflava]